MFGIFSQSLQQTLIKHGIISSLCFSVVSSTPLYAADSPPKKSLVILEEHPQGKVPERTNLSQKVQSLTVLAKEQADRIKALKEEIQSLKGKLHLTQLTNISQETGHYKQLYSALKQESAKNKETQSQLEKIIQDLKKENEHVHVKNAQAEAHILSLTNTLASQMQNLEKVEEHYKQQVENLHFSHHEATQYKELHAALEQELAHYKTTHDQLQTHIQQLKDENESEKEKIANAETHIEALKNVLREQMLSHEDMQNAYKSQLEQFSASADEQNRYKILYASMEQEFAQNKEVQLQLEQHILHLKEENQTEKERMQETHNHIQTLMNALAAQTISHQKELADSYSQVHDYKTLNKNLEQELSQAKKAHQDIDLLIQELQDEQFDDELGLNESDAYLSSLMDALEAQTIPLENLSEFASEDVTESDHQQIHALLEEELAKTKMEQTQLEQLIQQLKHEKDLDQAKISEAEEQMTSLIQALDVQTIAVEKLEETYKASLAESEQKLHEKNSIHELQLKNAQDMFVQLQAQLAHQEKPLVEENKEAITSLFDAWQIEYILSVIQRDQQMEHADTLLMHLLELKRDRDSILATLYPSLETLHLQNIHVFNNLGEEKIKQLLSNLEDEQNKTNSLQKNLDEVQQIYDQTVKLYNEMYADHRTAQKQMETLQKELDERKMNHLVSTDELEVKLENLSEEFKKEESRVQELEIQLTTALADLVLFQDQQANNDGHDMKNAYIHHLEALSLHEHLLHQASDELHHQKKIMEEQAQILQQVYQDKQSLSVQLQAIPFSADEVAQLENKHTQQTQEIENLKSAYYQYLLADTMQQDFIKHTQDEFEKYQFTAHEHEHIIQELQNEKEAQQSILTQKNEEIHHLTDQINQTEEQIRLQFREFAISLEEEKCKNDELQHELLHHNISFQTKQQSIEEINQELERLKNELALKDENYLLQKIEMEDLSDRLKQINAEKSKLMLHMQMVEEKEPLSFANDDYHAKLNQNIQELKDLIASKDETLLAKENDAKVNLEQRSKLEEDIQKLILEKNTLEENYHREMEHQKELKAALEQNLAELKNHKNTLEEYQKDQLFNHDIATKLNETKEEIELLKQQHAKEIADLQNKQNETESQIAKSHLTQAENEQLAQELQSLKNELDQYKERDSKITAVQLERLQEALQQMINEKTILQSQYQNQIITERWLTEKLEETLAELEQYKARDNHAN